MIFYILLFIVVCAFGLIDEIFSVGLGWGKFAFYTLISVFLSSLLFASKIRFLISYIFIYIVCALPAVIVGICNDNFIDMKITLLFNSALLTLFFMLIAFKPSKLAFGVIFGILALPSLFYMIYFSFTSTAFSTDALIAVLETTPAEASEYLKGKSNIFEYLFILLYLAFITIFVKINLGLKARKFNALLVLSCLALSSFLFFKNYRIYNIYTNLALNVTKYKNYLQNYQKNAALRLSSATNLKFSDQNGTFVVVIGESANKEHFSLFNENYAYKNEARETTPFLSALKKEPNLLLFSSAFSNHTHTTPTLSYALSAINQYNNIDIKSAISIIEIANLAKFNTFWLSNQPAFGGFGSALTSMANDAKIAVFNAENDTDFKLDEGLVKIFKEQEIKKGKNLIILHTMGSHWEYAQRYPKSFRKFSDGVIGDYDNSVLYTDFILNEILKHAKSLPDFKALIYLSDHGEIVGGAMHDSSQFEPKMSQIPFFIYFSDDFISSPLYSTLKSHLNATWTNDLLFNLLCSLLGISSSLDEPKNDISNPLYDSDSRRFRTLHGKQVL